MDNKNIKKQLKSLGISQTSINLAIMSLKHYKPNIGDMNIIKPFDVSELHIDTDIESRKLVKRSNKEDESSLIDKVNSKRILSLVLILIKEAKHVNLESIFEENDEFFSQYYNCYHSKIAFWLELTRLIYTFLIEDNISQYTIDKIYYKIRRALKSVINNKYNIINESVDYNMFTSEYIMEFCNTIKPNLTEKEKEDVLKIVITTKWLLALLNNNTEIIKEFQNKNVYKSENIYIQRLINEIKELSIHKTISNEPSNINQFF